MFLDVSQGSGFWVLSSENLKSTCMGGGTNPNSVANYSPPYFVPYVGLEVLG